MQDMRTHSYYGELDVPLVTKKNVNVYLADELFQRMLLHYEEKIIAKKDKILKDFKKSINKPLKDLDQKIEVLNIRIKQLETYHKEQIKKEKLKEKELNKKVKDSKNEKA